MVRNPFVDADDGGLSVHDLKKDDYVDAHVVGGDHFLPNDLEFDHAHVDPSHVIDPERKNVKRDLGP
jgi:hypothetical protein